MKTPKEGELMYVWKNFKLLLWVITWPIHALFRAVSNRLGTGGVVAFVCIVLTGATFLMIGFMASMDAEVRAALTPQESEQIELITNQLETADRGDLVVFGDGKIATVLRRSDGRNIQIQFFWSTGPIEYPHYVVWKVQAVDRVVSRDDPQYEMYAARYVTEAFE